MLKHNWLLWIKAALLGLLMTGALSFFITNLKPSKQQLTTDNQKSNSDILYEVKSVVDGDTIKIDYNGTETSVRLIGVNTPETVDPRTTVECFGKEASDYLKNLLSSKKVRIETDSSQADRDKYNRLLRYVYLDGEDVGYKIISNGYGYEYTYDLPYSKQGLYKRAQEDADKKELGLWANNACSESTTNPDSTSNPQTSSAHNNNETATNNVSSECKIKGNISYSGEKIYHVPGQKYYDSTKIDTKYGERWFCSEKEAQAAGWRKSKV